MKKGFTLIEVLVVIVLVSIFATIGVSGFLMQRERFQSSGEINEILTDLRYAKQMSITEQVHHGIIFDFENNSYHIFREDDIVKEKQLLLEIESVNDYNEVKFTRFGAVFKGGEVLIKSGDILSLIEIRPSGFFNVQRIDDN